MRDDDDEYGLDEGSRDLPRVVEEAHEVLGTYHLQVGAAAVFAVVGWGGALASGIFIPLSWLLLTLGALIALVVSPITREPRLAKDVIRRWDSLRVDRALASSGIDSDPRLEVAESMAQRIVRHPSSDERIRTVTEAMIRRLRRLLDDLRRTTYLATAQRGARGADETDRSMSDLQDLLDARVADVLGQLSQLHRTVVLRDSASLEGVVRGIEDLVHELAAEHEVERLLNRAENE